MAKLTAGEISQRFGYILGGIGRGLSGNQIIAELTTAGLSARRSTLLSLISTARDYYAKRVTVAGLDYNNPVPAEATTDWVSKNKTGYGFAVQVVARDIGTGGLKTLHYTAYSQTLLTPAQAVQQAIDAYSDQAELYRQKIEGAILANVVNYVPAEF